MRISDWSSDVCSSDLVQKPLRIQRRHAAEAGRSDRLAVVLVGHVAGGEHALDRSLRGAAAEPGADLQVTVVHRQLALEQAGVRSEEHTSELQSLMRISYAVFCLKKKKQQNTSKKDRD